MKRLRSKEEVIALLQKEFDSGVSDGRAVQEEFDPELRKALQVASKNRLGEYDFDKHLRLLLDTSFIDGFQYCLRVMLEARPELYEEVRPYLLSLSYRVEGKGFKGFTYMETVAGLKKSPHGQT